MMSKILTIILLLLNVATACGQSVNRHEADSLLILLNKSKPDTSRINLLLKLAEFQIFKPGENKPDLDSAASFISQAKVLNKSMRSKEADGYTTLVEAYLTKERGQREVAKKMVNKAIEILKTGKNKLNLGNAYFEASDYYNYNDSTQLEEKIRLVETALQAFKQTGNIERQAYSLKYLGDLYQIKGDYAKALQQLNLSLHAYKSIHYTELQGVYVLLGGLNILNGNYKQALNYNLMALKCAEEAHDTSMQLCQINNVIGNTLTRLDEREKAVSYYMKALQIAEKYNNNTTVLFLIDNIVVNYIKLNKAAEALHFINSIPKKFLVPKEDHSYHDIPIAYLLIYTQLKKYREAQAYCNQLLEAIKRPNVYQSSIYNSYQAVIKFYIESKQYTAAAAYIKKIDPLSLAIADPFLIMGVIDLKFMYDTATGNFRSATYHLLRSKEIGDSLFNETKSKQIKQLEVEYETEKKEDSLQLKNKDIVVLNQQYQLQQSNLQKAKLVRDVTIGGILLLLVIVGLLFWQYRQKKQTNMVISSKNEILEHLLTEKEWLLKEVHHRVKNNLQIIISLLNTQSNYLESETAIKAIRESQERMNAISLIHQKLYKSDDTALINIKEYVCELVENIRNGFTGSSGIVFDLDISDTQMDVAQAVPLGLILNEAVSNIFKYAFPGEVSGMVNISISHSKDDNSFRVAISDNGKGLPQDYDITKKASFGIRLMQGLSRQMGGSFKIENKNGVKITIVFNESRLTRLVHNKPATRQYV
jgi:two-component system, sensor histidine kinase PdtaS